MNSQNKVKTMTIAGLLSALGILIPSIAPGIMIEPASYTLASHVPTFIAMFISVPVGLFVAGITGLGFLFGGYPIVVVLRAFTHIIYATLGSYILSKSPNILNKKRLGIIFAIGISLVHAISEVVVVTLFYFGGEVSSLYYDKGYLISVILLVGLGTLIHSLIDFTISILVWKPIQSVIPIPANVRIKDTRAAYNKWTINLLQILNTL